jgi:hypothetical protein
MKHLKILIVGIIILGFCIFPIFIANYTNNAAYLLIYLLPIAYVAGDIATTMARGRK